MGEDRKEMVVRAKTNYDIDVVGTEEKLSLTPADVKNQINANASLAECEMFLSICRGVGANPFLKDVHLVKYSGSKPAAFVTGIGFMEKKAQLNHKFRGYGKTEFMVADKDGKLEWVDVYLSKFHQLLACKVRVYVDGYTEVQELSVSLEECDTGQANWKKMPGTMLEKVAKVRLLRKLFSAELAGLYTSEEMGTANQMDTVTVPRSEKVPTKPSQPSRLEAIVTEPVETVVEAEFEEAPKEKKKASKKKKAAAKVGTAAEVLTPEAEMQADADAAAAESFEDWGEKGVFASEEDDDDLPI